ncbi:MAG: quercetin dioxygenase-like cupin family protein [Psychromonas sp.]|jgi:quercetin dioxygenase-like cupin family protein
MMRKIVNSSIKLLKEDKMKALKLSLILSIIYTSTMAQLTEVNSGVYTWNELPVKEGNQRLGRKILEGTSPHFEYLEIHATTQEKGAKSSLPHTQEDIEEVLIVKEGLMEMTMDGVSKTLQSGSVILIPPLVEQSLRNMGDGPLTYYVMMFRSKKPIDMERSRKAGGAMFINVDDLAERATSLGSSTRYFDRPTATCEGFEMHVTMLNGKGPSHEPHTHVGSEIILMIAGETEMLIGDQKYKGRAGDLFFMESNIVHGISNIGEVPSKYFAFQWK